MFELTDRQAAGPAMTRYTDSADRQPALAGGRAV